MESREREWAVSLRRTDSAVALVRTTLRCDCPDTVFRHFQIRVHLSSEPPFLQAIMGDRLLLHIMDANQLEDMGRRIPRLLREGLSERDRRGLNRFRLLIVGEVPGALASKLMETAESMDPKAHVHVLPHLHEKWLDPGTRKKLQGV